MTSNVFGTASRVAAVSAFLLAAVVPLAATPATAVNCSGGNPLPPASTVLQLKPGQAVNYHIFAPGGKTYSVTNLVGVANVAVYDLVFGCPTPATYCSDFTTAVIKDCKATGFTGHHIIEVSYNSAPTGQTLTLFQTK